MASDGGHGCAAATSNPHSLKEHLMPTQLRPLLPILSALALSACFDPMIEPGGSDDSGSEGTTTEPTGTTIDPDEGQADSTGATDAPPVITAFTVDGSTMPQELQASRLVAFDVDAMDDVGIDRIEIYDGDTLLATVTEIPHRTEILLSSADNDSHSYSAVAIDTAGQSAESEVVPMSVNIIGGAILDIREDIGSFRLSPSIGAMPRIVIDHAGEVTIFAGVREDVVEDPRFGLSAISYTDTLSLLWADTQWPSENGPYVTFTNFGKPTYDTGSDSWWSGIGLFGDDELMRAVAFFDSQSEGITQLESIGPASGLFTSPLALDSTGAVILSEGGQLQKRATLDGTPDWTVELGTEVFVMDILVASDDSIIVTLTGNGDCLPGALRCVYRLSPNGAVLWTRPAPTSTASALGVALSPEGNVALAGLSDGPARLIVYDENGSMITDRLIAEERRHEVRDIAYDAQGMLVIAGDLQDDLGDGDREAWAGRFDEQGDPIWFHVYPFDSDRGVTGLATDAEGKLFAVGWENRFEQDLLGWSGTGWVAELSL